ncbi:DUF4249 domain-containing protein [Flavobacterium polysaccharolyticum]|uniref:DUF4249 domain-containing protein n=1 Tax=Flavobacterium polysaccharolyticum TaxID=3133148 RepID=A0ABU9NS72_9FLAO
MKKAFFILLSIVLTAGCEKEITLDLQDKSGSIVIEGNITDQSGPYYVRITKSVPFTESNKYTPVINAVVTISDNHGHSEILTYESNGRYKTSYLASVPGNTYNLNVSIDGENYTAQSTMPAPVTLNGLIQDSMSMGGKTTYTILPVYTDPQLLGNRYLFILSIEYKNKKTLQVFSDNINNGMENQRSLFPALEDDDELLPGNIIHVDMQCVDSDVYTYYSALVQISGGSVTPSDPPSNISNGALGYFSAHTVSSKRLVIK